MIFRSRSDHEHTLTSSHGTRFLPDYKRHLNEDGTFTLQASGDIDLYARIQAVSGGTDVYALIDTYRRTGDESVINGQKGAYIDVTSHPSTLAELEQFRINSRDAFYSLPVAVRDLFGQSFENFIRDPEKAMSVLAELERKPKGIINGGSGKSPDEPAAGGSPASEGGEG